MHHASSSRFVQSVCLHRQNTHTRTIKQNISLFLVLALTCFPFIWVMCWLCKISVEVFMICISVFNYRLIHHILLITCRVHCLWWLLFITEGLCCCSFHPSLFGQSSSIANVVNVPVTTGKKTKQCLILMKEETWTNLKIHKITKKGKLIHAYIF